MNVALLEDLLGLLKTLNETIGVPQGESIEDKNVLQGNNPSDPNKRVTPTLNSNERKRTTEIASLFAKTFFEYQKKKTPDKAIKTSIQKVTGKTGEKMQQKDGKAEAKSLLWKIIWPLVGAIAALIGGLMTDSPFKGMLKLTFRALLQMTKSRLKLLFNINNKLFKGLIPKNFIGNIITNGIKGFITSLKGMLGAPFKALGGMAKGGGFMVKIFKFLKPMLLVLKRIPLIGAIISFGFAISRFSSGDTVGGVIDVLSGLAGLLDLVAPGLGTTLSIGLDVLNAFIDIKTAGAKNKNSAKMDLLGDMAKGIGKWVWKNALWIPVIGGFKRMEMSWNAFKSGDIMGGLYQFGASMLSFGGLGSIVTGIEMLLGFGEKKESDKSLSPKTGWFSGLKAWIKKKLKDLPYALRKPLEWFGILDDGDGDSVSGFSKSMGDGYDKMKEFSSKTWKSASQSFSKGFEWYRSKTSALWKSASQSFSKGFEWYRSKTSALWKNMVKNFFKSVELGMKLYKGMIENFGKFFQSLSNIFKPAIDKIGKFLDDFVGGVVGWIKSLWSSDKETPAKPAENQKSRELTDQEKIAAANKMGHPDYKAYEKSGWKQGDWVSPEEMERRAKAMGWKTVEEYEKSNWGKNKNAVVSDAIKTVKSPKPEVSNTPNPNTLPVVQSGNQQSLEFLHNIGMTQIKIMGDIKGIAAQILKKMDSSMGGSNRNTVIPISSPTPGQKSSPISMNSNRGDYGSSAYALA